MTMTRNISNAQRYRLIRLFNPGVSRVVSHLRLLEVGKLNDSVPVLRINPLVLVSPLADAAQRQP